MLIQKGSFSSFNITNFYVKKNFVNKSMSHSTKTHCSSIPIFPRSERDERSELSSLSIRFDRPVVEQISTAPEIDAFAKSGFCSISFTKHFLRVCQN